MATLSSIITPTNVLTSTNTQTVSNKTIALGSNTVSGTKAQFDTAVTDDNFAYVGTNNSFSVVQTFGKAVQETKSAVAASDIDLSVANYFTNTISTTTTFTVSNVPASGTTASFILELTNGGSATVNWWSGVKWAGGTAPTLTAAGVDILGFYSHDGGTTWRGLVLAKDSK